MRSTKTLFAALFLLSCCGAVWGQAAKTDQPQTVTQVLDHSVSNVEHEFVSAADARSLLIAAFGYAGWAGISFRLAFVRSLWANGRIFADERHYSARQPAISVNDRERPPPLFASSSSLGFRAPPCA